MIRKAILWVTGNIFLLYVMLPLVAAMWDLNEQA